MNKPLFSIVLIARNEEKTLPRLFSSLGEFKERGGEIILMDTGSTDNTVEVAKSFGCTTIEVGTKFIREIDEELAQKINEKFLREGEELIVRVGEKLFDYASARNHAASFALNDMIAMPDCDETYTQLNIDIVDRLISEGIEQFEYQFVFNHDEFNRPIIQFLHSKFYNRTKQAWVGIIHEILQGESKRQYVDESIIKLEHYQNHETNRSGYLKGLALDCLENPENDRNSHYFGRELLWTGRPGSAIKELKRHIEMNRWPAERCQSMIYIGEAYLQLGDETEAIEWWNRAILADGGRRIPYIRLADFYAKKDDPQRVACYAMASLQIKGGTYYAENKEYYSNYPHELLYWAFSKLGNKEGEKYHFDKALSYKPHSPKYLYDYRFNYNLPKISVVIPTLGREEKLKTLLESIEKNANYPNYEVIVEHDSFENRKGVPITVKNAVEKTTGDFVMYLGNDCIAQPNFMIEAYIKMKETFPEEDGLVGLNDMYWTGEFATHWMASKKLLPHLDGEFFHTGYYHTGCDNELTERCRMRGKYVWAEHAKVFHDHPVQKGFKDEDMDEVYRLAYDRERVEHDKNLLNERAKLLGFKLRENFTKPRSYPNVHPCYDLRLRIPNPQGLRVLNVGVGNGQSGLASQLPFIRFKQLDNLDTHKQYLDDAEKVIYDSEEVNFIHSDIRDVDNFDNYDLVLMFDVLEHLLKEESLQILEKIPCKKVVFIPLEEEFRPNHEEVEAQDHLSLWTEEDFKSRGFQTEVLKNFHNYEGKSWDALWAIK